MDAGPIHDLCQRLGHEFAQSQLLTQALTHPSVAQGRAPRRNTPYERLEFLGDRVLGLVVADMLFHRFPTEAEGALARRHAALVRRESLAVVAGQIGLPPCLTLSKGEEDAGGRGNPALLADACEAVIGALYADAGFEVAARFVRSAWTALMDAAAQPPKDAKTALQEWAQGLGKPLPVYAVVGQDGPPHDPTFVVSVTVEGVDPVHGTGASKRVAEQAAAALLLEKVKA
ncbi:Ribonuclease 3 [Magnetospirillum gryphiswaldense MSR-1 v2]|uniref:Ribonuclease 3 n=1 Tax=Magnetospirillum gryphiswaldense (strain DSM 6361 / JCM 21280 / NBRC 15271 / MSR-1) TaxID=431944 RepID=V6EYI5_MAGGM|nr:ribonuclease III [Magnetospirillum gryphiswaldense]CDK98300.1 Ribonuclease 3 [Magnetospirillum gryphiswaldense MSR-1 v2]